MDWEDIKIWGIRASLWGGDLKTTIKQFNLFKKECEKWADRFELSGWRFDFYLKSLEAENAQAQVIRDYLGCIIRVHFCTEIRKASYETWSELIKDTAKHEMTHVLVSNLTELAKSRYITEDELEKAEEELVVKLEDIIK